MCLTRREFTSIEVQVRVRKYMQVLKHLFSAIKHLFSAIETVIFKDLTSQCSSYRP